MSQPLSILAWNILHGGGPRRTPEIALALAQRQPDVVVLCEFRRTRGSSLRAALADAGLVYQIAHIAPEQENTVFIAGRYPLRRVPVAAPPQCQGRFLAASLYVEDELFSIAGVHIPDDGAHAAKAAYWQFLLSWARTQRDHLALVVGDLNTARRGPDTSGVGFRCEALLGNLISLGFVDAWRAGRPGCREDTWQDARGFGGRIDAAMLSPRLSSRLCAASHVQEWRTRGLSDHAALDVRLDLRPSPAPPPAMGLFPA